MKARCIKSDPMGWLKEGIIYNIFKKCDNWIVEGEGIAFIDESLKEHFEILEL